ncbi:MAG: sugar isomerase [Planctomycetota bacterium]
MNQPDKPYTDFGLCRDMLEAPAIVAGFEPDRVGAAADALRQTGKLHLTGEGSSRLFPAKHVIKVARQRGYPLQLHTEAGLQSRGYPLADWAVLGASNSGRTAEVIQLFKQLKDVGHDKLFSLTAFAESKLESFSSAGYVLGCGAEGAVAATKSVIEQALVIQAIVEAAADDTRLAGELSRLSTAMQAALTAEIPSDITKMMADSPIIYWAGPNDGVAEELTLKTNEITRKPSDYLEGTYAAHGIEEVMNPGDTVLWIDPIADQEQKFEQVLVKGVGVHIVCISTRDTRFPTIRVADAGDMTGYAYLSAGWNLLVEAGLALGVDIDKPERARKVGNEFVG